MTVDQRLKTAIRWGHMRAAARLLTTLCGVLVQHAPGIGTTRMCDQWAIMRLEDLTQMIKLANKQGGKQ